MTNPPVDFWKHGRMLLHQQCWCWGRDIESPYGNLLLEAGFERIRPPQGVTGSTRYVRAVPGEPAISLWAFGVTVGSPAEAAIYINRYCFVPRWIPEPDFSLQTWNARSFDGLRPPFTRHEIRTSKRLLKLGMQWLADYEEQILNKYGVSYRRDVLWNWHESSVLPERLPNEWRRLSWHIPEPPIDCYLKPDENVELPSMPEPTPSER